MAEKGIGITVLSKSEVRLGVPWVDVEGFWQEDYAQQKAQMLEAATERVGSYICGEICHGSSRHLRRKIPFLNQYKFHCMIPEVSFRLAYRDFPLDEKGTAFMETQGDTLVLRFPDMNEMMQFLGNLSQELGGFTLELREEINSIHYELYTEATIRI